MEKNLNERSMDITGGGDSRNDQVPFKYGLRNMGNSCYMNAILACLFGCPRIVEKLVNRRIMDYLNEKGGNLKLLKSFVELLYVSHANQIQLLDRYLNNFHNDFFETNNLKHGAFVKGNQEDASEFLVTLTDWLISIINESVEPNMPAELSNALTDAHMLFHDFYVNITQITTCVKGHRSTHEVEELLMLSLEETDVEINTIMARYFQEEYLPECRCVTHLANSNCNAYYCRGCKAYTSATKSCRITRVPTVLVIGLKIFKYKKEINQLQKLKPKLHFGTNELNIINYLSDDSNLSQHYKYELFGLTLHSGPSLHGGHYTAMINNFRQNQWRHYNDNMVKIIKSNLTQEIQNISAQPYILFYRKKVDNVNSYDQYSQYDAHSATERILNNDSSPILRIVPITDEVERVPQRSAILIEKISKPRQQSSAVSSHNVSESNTYSMNSSMFLSDESVILSDVNSDKSDKKKRTHYKRRTVTDRQARHRDRERKRSERSDESKGSLSRSKDSLSKRQKRESKEYRDNETTIEVIRQRQRRKNQEYKQRDNAIRAERDKEKRESPTFRKLDNEKKRARKELLDKIIERYETGIAESTDYVCVSCGGLFFRRSVYEFTASKLAKAHLKYTDVVAIEIKFDSKLWICRTCSTYVTECKVPRLNLSKGLIFPDIPDCINDLNRLELRIVSPRICFMKIKALGWDKQRGLVGNAVNVPLDVDNTISELPRNFNSCETIVLQWMRQMHYKNPYLQDTIRPPLIKKAIDFLLTTPLFNKLNITVSTSWFRDPENSNLERVFEPDVNDNISSSLSLQINNDNDGSKEYDIDLSFNDPNEGNLQVNETLLQQDKDRIFKIAPGQGNMPIAVVNDIYAEEGAFIDIFGGQLMSQNIDTLITISARCKSFFRRYDRRCAKNIEYIFFMYRKLMAEKLHTAISMALRKHRSKQKLTVTEILDNYEQIDEFLATDDLKRFLRTIRSSPEYWAKRKKDLFAMVRQLGSPTIFLTLSPAEVDWPELIIILMKLVRNIPICKADAEDMSREAKIELIAQDPVTTARYFENRMDKMFNYMKNRHSGPFKEHPVEDSYDRTEIQSRGSPHNHSIHWLQDAPRYNLSDPNDPGNQKCIAFIDSIITAASPCPLDITYDEHEQSDKIREENDAVLRKIIRFQRHVHRQNCIVESEGDEIGCKSSFPRPILDETIILHPLLRKTAEQKEAYYIAQDNYRLIKTQLNIIATQQEKDLKIRKPIYVKDMRITLEPFLRILKMNFVDYITALRSSIRQPTVFLKRSSLGIMINNYNRQIILRHRANMDIQYVLNSYALSTYVTSYMMKTNAVVSRLLNTAVQEIKQGNMNVKKKLFVLANKFQNCTEESAQSCVYHLLSMPVSRCSRESVFIMTFKRTERFSMLKDKKILELLRKANQNSDNIYQIGMIDYYIARNETLSHLCLAEFAAYYNFYTKDHFLRLIGKSKLPLFEEFMDSDDEDLYQHERRDYEYSDQTNSEESSKEIDDLPEHNKKPKNYEKKLKPSDFIALKDNIGFVRKRAKSKIINYRRYNKTKEPDNYYREQLLLFLPWCDEEKEIENVNHFDVFVTNKEIIGNNRSKFEQMIPDDDAEDALDQLEKEIEKQYELAADDQAQNLAKHHQLLLQDDDEILEEGTTDIDREVLEEMFGYHAPIIDPEIRHKAANNLENAAAQKAAKRLGDNHYKQLMTSLNRRQHCYLLNVLHLMKRNMVFYHFVTGGAGTGKSRLISAIDQCANRYFDKIIPKEEDYDKDGNKLVRVLLCAFTGKAAFNIKGTTIHSAFHFAQTTDDSLAQSTIDKVRKVYKNLKLIIIDEISLVGSSMLFRIDSRLKMFFNEKEAFGGIPIISFGDFNQLPPVMDQYIFQPDLTNAYHSIISPTANILWARFRFFELNEIMRQRDDLKFAQALTRLGNDGILGLTPEDVQMFDSRIVSSLDQIPDDAIYLFTTNEQVKKHNDRRLNSMPGGLTINVAVDTVKGSKKDTDYAKKYTKYLQNLDHSRTGNLSTEIKLKIGAKYMITNNIDVLDGLVNGTCGVLKAIMKRKNIEEKTVNGKKINYIYAETLWFDFFDEDVGKNARETNQYKYKKYDGLQNSWTPLFPYTTNVRIEVKKVSITREQFPIIECEALTLHKCQGQTYKRVALKIDQINLTKQFLYVALSRVTKIDDLYLYGKASIVEGKDYKRYSASDRKLKVQVNRENSATHQEFQRMRHEAQLVNYFPCLSEKQDSLKRLSICFQNVMGLQPHLDQIKADFGLMSTDVLLFVECHTHLDYINMFLLSEYNILRFTGSVDPTLSNGCVCYFKKNLNMNIEFVADNSRRGYYTSVECLEISCFRILIKHNWNYFVYLYNHPKNKWKNFIKEFKEFLTRHIPNIGLDNAAPVFIFGDFNREKKDLSKDNLLDLFHLKLKFAKLNGPTTDRGTSIDWLILNSNLLNMESYLYESFYSDHKSIIVNVDKD